MLRVVVIGAMVMAAGCTRPNPAYGVADESGTRGGDDDQPITSEASVTTQGSGPDVTSTSATATSMGSSVTSTGPDVTSTGADTFDEPDVGVAAACGNGIHEPPTEQCDDGNATPKDGCNAACALEHPELCGNGMLDPGEQCDDLNEAAKDGCGPTCQLEHPELCGDGDIDEGEQCDGGNTKPGDGCGATCQNEIG